MKKCDYYKDLILTVYIDGELEKNSTADMEGHLLDCGECRAFLSEVKSAAVLSFRQALPQAVPAGLWEGVKQAVEIENQRTSPIGGFISKLKGLVLFPRMVPVFASLVLMLFVGSATINNIQVQQAKAQDRGEYLVALLSPTASSDNNDLDTSIEHYFL